MAAGVPCTRCRQRRVKCDRRQPGCVRCEKSSQPCPGYNRLRGFMDEGVGLRKRFPTATAPVKTPGSTAEQDVITTPKTFPSIRADDLSKPPPGGTISDGAGKLSSQGATTNPETMLDSTIISDDMTDAEFDSIFFDIDPQAYYAEGNNCCGFLPNMPLTDGAGDVQGPTLSWHDYIALENFPPSTAAVETSESIATASITDYADEADAETSHLIRYFAEHISPSLDIFDVERFFGHAVPVKALRSALLTSSLAAIASKHFGKMSREGVSLGKGSIAMLLDQYPDPTQVDWFYKAAGFYDKAIGRMLLLLQDLRDGNVAPVPEQGSFSVSSPSSTTGTSPATPPLSFKRRRIHGPERKTDDLLVAISVFLLYESLDHRQAEVLHHMSGAQYLLDFDIKQLNDPAANPKPLAGASSIGTKAWQASFWNFACVDYVVSYTEQTFPRLDTDDLDVWNAAGLPLRQIGSEHLPASLCNDDTIQMSETVACRTLIWIVLKALSIIAAEKHEATVPLTTSSKSGPRRWDSVQQHLEDWAAIVPDTFDPCMRTAQPVSGYQAENSCGSTPNTNKSESLRPDTTGWPELYFSNPMCATAVGLYHFVQILLLLHRPLERGSLEPHSQFVNKRLNAYRQLSEQIEAHSREISAISRGRPGPAVRMHLVEPLHLAGLCTEQPEERLRVADLLLDTQKETGFSTEWSVAHLRAEWGV